jgi:hypothetical protein
MSANTKLTVATTYMSDVTPKSTSAIVAFTRAPP